MDTLSSLEWGAAIGVAVLVIAGVFIGIRRLQHEKRGLAVDDELSNQVKQKAGAQAFAYSFYLWLFLLLFFVDKQIDPEVLIGAGVLGMGLLFVILWAWYARFGIRPEDPAA